MLFTFKNKQHSEGHDFAIEAEHVVGIRPAGSHTWIITEENGARRTHIAFEEPATLLKRWLSLRSET